MKINCFKITTLFIILNYWLLCSVALAVSLNPSIQKAKQNADAKGYLFVASREEILAMAKKEGKLSAMASMDSAAINAMRDAFKAEYPFLNISIEESTGSEANRRFLMELKAGRDTGLDATHMSTDAYGDFLPYMKKIDVMGMAEQRVLQVPVKAIDPTNRNTAAAAADIQVVAYNKKLISPQKIPATWEGFLTPEFKGRRFLADIRPTEIAALVPAWGLERTLDFSRKIAAQQPIWVRGASRMMTSMIAGEYAVFIGPDLSAVKRLQAKDPTDSLDYKIVEPVPVRFNEATGILNSAKHPHAALLWLDFIMGPKGQAIIDKYEPCAASIFSPGSFLSLTTRGKQLSMVSWDQFIKMRGYQEKVVEAYGFPKAEIKK